MFNTDVNYLAVLVAGIVPMIVGFLWYSQVLFANQWMKALGKSKEQVQKEAKEKGPWMYIWTFFAALLTVWVLAIVMKTLDVKTVSEGLQTGLLVWFGFVMTTQIPEAVFNGTKKDVVMIYVGYQLVCFLINGALLAWWK